MLVSHSKKFIFVKTIKTASTSVECYFEPFCFEEGSYEYSHTREESITKYGIVGFRGRQSTGYEYYNHMTIEEIRAKVNNSIFDGYYKFCVVRNPFTRLISLYHMEMRILRITEDDEEVRISRFRNWLAMRYPWDYSLDRFYTIGGEVQLDYFIKFENLLSDLEEVCHSLDIKFDLNVLRHIKKGNYTKFESYKYYDEASIALVEKHCQREMSLFNYSFPKD